MAIVWQSAGTIEILAEPVLTTIAVSPATATVSVGGTRQFTAATLDQNGDIIDAGEVEWSVIGKGIIDQNGLYTAPAESSTDEIVARIGYIVGSATVTVMAHESSDITVYKKSGRMLKDPPNKQPMPGISGINVGTTVRVNGESFTVFDGKEHIANNIKDYTRIRRYELYIPTMQIGGLDQEEAQ